MDPLTIRLLGNPEISVGGEPISFRTRKALALLVYLVVEEKLFSREALMALFWPESPAEKAAIALRVTLSRLRKDLMPAGEVLVATGGQIGFDFRCPLDLDLAWLSAAALPEFPPEDLASILELDQGEFLAGFSLPDAPEFDLWSSIQREASQRQAEAIYDRWSQIQMTNHDSALAIETATRWVARAPLSEAAYRRLMAAQALSGDRPAALKTYADCQAMLQAEFGIEPARETVLLAENIRQDRIADLSGPHASGPAVTGSRSSFLPFAGRADEHHQLVDAFRRASQGQARTVALIGAAGVGKTRLVSAFREWASLDTPGVEFWEGRAFEIGGRLPYQPVIEALRLRLEQENAPEDLLDDIWLSELSQLMPELRARYPDLPLPMTGDASFIRSRLFSAVANLCSALAARNPAVLVVDDLQWADVDTRDLIHFLARRWAETRTPIFLLLTVRQESFATDARLREWLVQLGRDTPVQRLLIDSLSGTAVRKMVARLAATNTGGDTTGEFGDWLWAETGGLPFFIEALLQMLVGEGILAIVEAEDHRRYDFAGALAQVRSGRQVQVPPGVREAIRSRLDRLSEPEADLLLASAVLGREGSFESLCKIANLSEAEALQAIETLLNGNLVAESRAARRPYNLAHDYIREVAYGDAHAVRRRIFHRRALNALEEEHASAAECAYHAAACLLDEPAFRYSLAAGDQALQSNALVESLAHYDRAREIAGRMGSEEAGLTPQALKRLYQNRGRVLELNTQYQEALANYQALENLAAQQDNAQLKLAAIIPQCILYATYNPVFDPDKARELGQAALELAVNVQDQEAEARALWCLMLVEFHVAGKSKQVLAYGEKALSLARTLGLKELQAYVLGNLSWAYSFQMQPAAARQANAEALKIWRELGNLPMVADAISIKMGNLRFLGEIEAQLAAAGEVAQLGQEIGNAMHHFMGLLMMGEAHGLQGRFGQALTDLELAGVVAQESGDERLAWGHIFYQIQIYLYAGDFEQAERLADQLYASNDWKKPIFHNYFLATFAWAKIAAGKLQESEAILEMALPEPDEEAALTTSSAPVVIANARLQFALGNSQGALDCTEDLIQKMNQGGWRFFLADLYLLQGKACLALEDAESARRAFLQAKTVAETTGERVYLWQALAELSELDLVLGNQLEAEAFQVQTGEIIGYIADHAGSEALRGKFLAQPRVQRILTG